MSTLREIIDYAKRKYPSSESDANCIIELNDIQTNIHLELKKLKNEYTTTTIHSVASQEDYDLPALCRMEDIIKITVDDIDGEFYYAGISDDTLIGNYYQRSATITKFKLLIDDAAITTTDSHIIVSYYPRPTTFTAASETPTLDADYHAVYKYALVNVLASQGDNPDTEIADYYQKKYDELMSKIKESLSDRLNNAPTRRPEMKERM